MEDTDALSTAFDVPNPEPFDEMFGQHTPTPGVPEKQPEAAQSSSSTTPELKDE